MELISGGILANLIPVIDTKPVENNLTEPFGSPLTNISVKMNNIHPKYHRVPVYWCLNRHLCDLREGFGKKHLNLVIVVLRNMFRKMCSVKCVPQSVL